MPDSESVNFAELRKKGVCPNCGILIVQGTAVIRGSASFCSLDCVALFYQVEFTERARRLAAALRN